MILKKVCLISALWVSVLNISAQDSRTQWVDSVFRGLSVSQKIGQLFMIPVSAGSPGDIRNSLTSDVKDYGAGAVIITKGGPGNVARLVNALQRSSPVPLLVGLPVDKGLSSTLDSMEVLPPPIVQSSWENDSLNFAYGLLTGNNLKMLGIQIAFGPRIDLYGHQADYQNYFSNNKKRLVRKSSQTISGLQAAGIIACPQQVDIASSFPVYTDSSVFYDANRLDTIALDIPLQMVKAGTRALLTNHFSFSIIEKAGRKAVPASLSPVIIGNLLKKKMHFGGLAITDIRSLLAITTKKKRGEIEFLAFLAGNDLLIAPQNPKAAIRKIQKEIKKDRALAEQLDQTVKKILTAKYDAGLYKKLSIPTDNLISRLNGVHTKILNRQWVESSITVFNNVDGFLPIKTLEGKKFLSLSIGADINNEFSRYLSRYTEFQNRSVNIIADTATILPAVKNADVIIVGVYPQESFLQNSIVALLKKEASQKEIIICHFGNPMDVGLWQGTGSVIAAYRDDKLTQSIAAQIIFGGLGANGNSPVDVSAQTACGAGIKTSTMDRFSYTLPEAAGMDSKSLDQIQYIAQEAIDNKATPGCRVFVARHGKVIYDKSFGYLTYDKSTPVTEETLYDLASVTKVTATLQAVMFMQERGMIDINKKISVYLPELKNSDKKDFIIKDILTHQAGLWPFLPFWLQTMKDSTYLPEYYSHSFSADYPFPVAKDLFASRSIKDSLWQWIVHAKIIKKTDRTPYTYRYSDMAFYMMQHLAEKLLNQPLEDFVEQNIYAPMGCSTTGYLPLQRFSSSRIAPTEDDKTFRKGLLVGYVHDQGAALHGGIAGHAGLFSNANDLAKLGQMWLQKGSYGGQQYFKPRTLELFTQKQYENSRRGLGWDRPVHSDPDGPTSIYSSQSTFGHTGFTGTCVWVDPKFDLVYVFLSNRVYPDMNNNKILNANIRPRIQDLIYRSIFNYCAVPN